MWYRFEITVPAKTAAAAPERHEIKIPPGVITGVRIRFPPGPRGTVSIGIFLGAHQMWPRGHEVPIGVPDRPGPQTWFKGDNEWIEWEDHVETETGDHWSLVGFSPAATKSHVVYVDIFVLEAEYARPMDPIRELVNTLKRVIGL